MKQNRSLALFLLKLVMPEEDAEFLTGDFEQLYSEISREKNRLYAWFWLWGQVMLNMPGFLSLKVIWMSELIKNNFISSVRNIKKSLGFSLINIVGLGMGMAAVMLIFMFVHSETGMDKFHDGADRIYRVNTHQKGNSYMGRSVYALSPIPVKPEFLENIPEIEAVTRIDTDIRSVLSRGAEKFSGRGLWSDEDFFKVFSFKLIKGDRLTSLKGVGKIVISENLRRQFFGDEEALGKIIKINDKYNLEVTGILEEVPENSSIKFDYIVSDETRLKDNSHWIAGAISNWQNCILTTWFKVSEGTAHAEIQKKVDQLMKRNRKPEFNKDTFLIIQPFTDIYLKSNCNFEPFITSDMRTVELFSAIGFVILALAFINYVNLTTARIAERSREVSIRKIVGGTGKQIFWQHMAEAGIFSVMSMGFALIVSVISAPLAEELTGRNMSLLSLPLKDAAVFLTSLVLLSALFAGLWPALKVALSKADPMGGLRSSNSGKAAGKGVRNFLTAFQLTTSVVLIVSAGIIVKQLWFIQNHDSGFQRERVVIVRTIDQNFAESYEAFRAELMNEKGIVDVTSSYYTPARVGTQTGTPTIDGEGRKVSIPVFANCVGDNFIEFYGIQKLMGESFKTTGLKRGVLVNEALVKKLGWKDPIGKSLPVNGYKDAKVVGVIRDFNFASLHNKIAPLAFVRVPDRMRMVAVKVRGGSSSEIIATIKKVFERYEHKYTFVYSWLDDDYRMMYRQEMNLGKVIGSFAILAVLIAGMGLLGTSTWTIRKRIKEIGVRKVLGASVTGIVSLLIKEFMKLVIIGNLIAWPVAWFIMDGWLGNFAFRTDTGLGIFLFAGAGTALMTIAVIVTQAVKAAGTNPINILRQE